MCMKTCQGQRWNLTSPMWPNKNKLKYRKFHRKVKKIKKSIILKIVKHWNKLQRDIVVSLSSNILTESPVYPAVYLALSDDQWRLD